MLPRTQNSSINLAIGNTGDGYYFQGGQSGWNLSVNSGDVSLYGGSQILNGQLLIGNSGDNSFEQGYIYGQSGVIVNSGTANLGISIDSSLVVTTGQTGQFYSNQNINNYCTSGNLTNTGINILNEMVSLSGNLLSTGQNLQNQINSIPGSNTGNLYPSYNPSGFLPLSGSGLIPIFGNIQIGVNQINYIPTTTIDFNNVGYSTIILTGDVSFTSSNLFPGLSQTVRIIGNTGAQNLSFPSGWTFVGATIPTSLAGNKISILTMTSFGITDTDIIAAYAAQP